MEISIWKVYNCSYQILMHGSNWQKGSKLVQCGHKLHNTAAPAWMEPMFQCSLAAKLWLMALGVSFLVRPSCCQSISFSLISTLSSLALSTQEQCSWGCQSYEITTSVTVVSSSWKKCLAAVLDQLHRYVAQASQSNFSRMSLIIGTISSDVCTANVPEMKSFCTSMTTSASLAAPRQDGTTWPEGNVAEWEEIKDGHRSISL